MSGPPADPTTPPVQPGWAAGAGIFLIALAGLMDEILLTRIFSVVTWYHFAFVAISVALFGLTAGALIVYLFPRRFPPEKTLLQMAWYSLLFSLSMAACFLLQIRIPFSTDLSAGSIVRMAAIVAAVTVPFVFGGICICLALTRFPERVGRLYAADLAGAASACVLVIGVLEITDGPTAMFVAAAIAACGAAFLAAAAGSRRLLLAAAGAAVLLTLFSGMHTVLVRRQAPILRLASVKGAPEAPPLYERWNSFSRIRVRASPTAHPLGWGLSEAYPGGEPIEQLILDIDGGASTVLTRFDGDLARVGFLRYDVTGLPYHLRPGGRVLAIGAGGGRDVLTALVFGARDVTGVEINDAIVETVTGRFGAFTGHLDRLPGVAFVNDEARSYVARGHRSYDVIQASLIDTSAATAAGAFSFTENSIYTVEAWDLFLGRLNPRGILSFSWFYFADLPAEMYRLTVLAREALARRGVTDPAAHVIVVRHRRTEKSVGTILVSPDPFDPEDIGTLERVAAALRFEIVAAPARPASTVFADILQGRAGALRTLPLRLDAPTDDSPFFFNMLRVRDAFNPAVPVGGPIGGNLKAVRILVVLFVVAAILTALTILLPLALPTGRSAARDGAPHLLYFAAIGFGFMLIEISQMQRLTLFLGHPTYGLSVVLFTLLLAGGLGSWTTRALPDARLRAGAARRLGALVVLLAVMTIATPPLLEALSPAPIPLRCLLAVVVLFPAGFLMGTAFPIGLRLAQGSVPALTPWLWGINGAASVCATVLATVIALAWGISVAAWAGAACYLVTWCTVSFGPHGGAVESP